MFAYTVMREVENVDGNDALWLVWEVSATSPTDAVETAADIPGEYIVFEGEGQYITVSTVSKLKADAPH